MYLLEVLHRIDISEYFLSVNIRIFTFVEEIEHHREGVNSDEFRRSSGHSGLTRLSPANRNQPGQKIPRASRPSHTAWRSRPS